MGNLHWLIVIPYYFFGALVSLLFLILVARLLRLKVSVNFIVTTAVVIGLGLVLLPLLAGWAKLRDYDGWKMLLLAAASFLFAGFDTVLRSWLPLPLDQELEEL